MTRRVQASASQSSHLRAALGYAKRGWYVFPCMPQGKQPLRGSRGFKDATRDLATIRAWWEQHPDANIGLVPGPSGLLVLDFDGPKGEQTAAEFGIGGSPTLGVRTGRGRHQWYRHPGGKIGNAPLGPGMDVRADNGYVLVPPSVHPSGAIYQWIKGDVLPLPAHIAERLRAKRKPVKPTTKHVVTEGVVTEGGRNNALTSHLGRIRRRGGGEEDLLQAAVEFNRTCKPPLDEHELLAVVTSVVKYPPHLEDPDAALEELNRIYAVVQIGGKVRILQDCSQEFEILPRDEFRLLFSNRFVGGSDRPQNVADFWLKHRGRRQFARLDFVPGHDVSPDTYNLWRGWGVQPRADRSCQYFLAHLRDNVCSGDPELYRWVLAWFAQLFQHPANKPGTALVLRGPQGTGKTLVGEAFGRLLGTTYLHVASGRMVTGQFNQHLAGALLLHADEAFWAGDKQHEGTLKDLITSKTQWIERKGIDPVQVRNYVRLLVTSNEEWVIPAGLEERRFAVLDVATQHMQDKVYFKGIWDELENGGYEALLYECLHLDLTGIDLRTIPRTAALFSQKLASLSPEHGWFLEVLQRGTLPGDKRGTGLTPRAKLYQDYLDHTRNLGARWRSIQTRVGIFLKKHVPGLTTHHNYEGERGDEGPCYVFPPLAACRNAFAKVLGHPVEWDGPDEWQPEPERAEELDDSY